MTIIEVAVKLGITQERVRQLTTGYKGYQGKFINSIFKEDIHYKWELVGNRMKKNYDLKSCIKAYHTFKIGMNK